MQIVWSLYRCVVVLVLAVCTLGLLAVTTSAQNAFNSGSTGADGALVFSTPPSSRSAHAMAYDAGRQRVVLFGGNVGGSPVNDTWEYNGTSWAQRAPSTSPSNRYSAMAYDTARQRVVLFGGRPNNSAVVNDTWEYDGTTWTQRTPATAPPARELHAMAYDTARQRVVLFGGVFAGSFNDTWEYDGTTWTQRTPTTAPPARNSHAMVYDSTHQVTVLFGGCCNDTWLWNGTSWTAPMPVQTASVIDMSTKPDGIWHYTTIDIPAGTTVSFKPNAANTPVVWLATGPVCIAGTINLDGASGSSNSNIGPGNEAPGGPGGGAGGVGGRVFNVSGSFAGTPGEGPGGGLPGTTLGQSGGGGATGRRGRERLEGQPTATV